MSQNFDPNQNYYFYNKKESIPIVFIHGVGLDHKMWNNQVDYLNEFSILTYDLLGHGKTPYNKEKLSLKDFSDQLLGILDYLNIETVSYTHLTLPTKRKCRSRWSPYH